MSTIPDACSSIAPAMANACVALNSPPASFTRQMPPSSAGTMRNSPGQAEGRKAEASDEWKAWLKTSPG
jgi:hypothetical protein